MGQKLRDDKIGQLTHNAGNIIMAASLSNPAYLTIGGQQYKVTSNLVVALPVMSANTRYQVFAVLNAGVVELRISQNENSVGPAGFNRWKLVGSLQSNGLSPVAFGAFVNTKGAPRFSSIDYLPTTSGFGTISSNFCKYSRLGREMFIVPKFTTGTVTGAQAAFSIPANNVIDVNFSPSGAVFKGVMLNNSNVGITQLTLDLPTDTSNIKFSSANALGALINGNTSPFASGQVQSAQGFWIPIVGWSDTPIEDL